MSQATIVPPFVNNAMKFMLRSPAHGMVSKNILFIIFTGCKSGKTYTTPVCYSQESDQVYIFTHAKWWKNLCNCTSVTLRLRGREVRGVPEPIVEDKGAIAARLTAHLQRVPSDARYYDVTFDEHGNPRAEEVKKAVQTVVMIRVQLF